MPTPAITTTKEPPTRPYRTAMADSSIVKDDAKTLSIHSGTASNHALDKSQISSTLALRV